METNNLFDGFSKILMKLTDMICFIAVRTLSYKDYEEFIGKFKNSVIDNEPKGKEKKTDAST